MVRQLIYRGSRKTVTGTDMTEQIALMRQHPVVVHGRIPEIGTHGIHTMPLDRGCQCLSSQIQRLGPLNLDMAILTRRGAHPPHGFSESIGILVNILERHCLGANVPATQGVITITANIHNRAAFGPDNQTAHRLTQMADTVMRLLTSFTHRALARV